MMLTLTPARSVGLSSVMHTVYYVRSVSAGGNPAYSLNLHTLCISQLGSQQFIRLGVADVRRWFELICS